MDCTRKHAVVTGASSGIGRATAFRLADSGFHVFATVRRSSDGEALRQAAGDALTPVIMDVTLSDQIEEAAKTVDAHVGQGGLDVLVNNAGIGLFEPLEFLPLEKFRRHLEVNTVGPLAVTQALLPALRVAAGRVVLIGSTAGWFTMPFGGSHAATKHALVGLAEALRQELAAWRINVILVEPGTIHSAATDKLDEAMETVLQDLGPEGRSLYADAYSKMVGRSVEEGRRGSDPDVVARVVMRAVGNGRPRKRYLAGKHSRLSALLVKLPGTLLEPITRTMFGLPKPGSLVERNAEGKGSR